MRFAMEYTGATGYYAAAWYMDLYDGEDAPPTYIELPCKPAKNQVRKLKRKLMRKHEQWMCKRSACCQASW